MSIKRRARLSKWALALLLVPVGFLAVVPAEANNVTFGFSFGFPVVPPPVIAAPPPVVVGPPPYYPPAYYPPPYYPAPYYYAPPPAYYYPPGGFYYRYGYGYGHRYWRH